MSNKVRKGERVSFSRYLIISGFALFFICALFPLYPQDVTAFGPPLPGLIENDSDGAFSGFAIEIMNEIGKREKWNLNYQVHPLRSEGIQSLLNGDIPVLFLAFAHSEERDLNFDFSEEVLLYDWGQVFSRHNSQVNSLFDLKGKMVGTVKGDINGLSFMEITRDFGISVEIIEYISASDLAEGLEKTEVDYIALSNLVGMHLSLSHDMVANPIVFSPSTLHVAMAKDQDTSFISVVDRYLHRWKQDNSSPYFALVDKYFASGNESEIPITISVILFSLLAVVLFAFSFSGLLQYRVNKQTKVLKLREDELELLNMSLEQKIEERTEEIKRYHEHILLSEKSADLGQMIGGLAHELNTPLGVSLMALNTLKEKSANLIANIIDKRDRRIHEESLDLIETNLNRTTHILTVLKDLSMDLRHDEISDSEIAGLVERVVDWVNIYKENKNIELRINVEKSNIRTYAGALTQSLSNIITNAISHGYYEKDEGKIAILGKVIEDNRYELEVIDDGRGFSKEELQMATHAFYTSLRSEGYIGLGLTIARSIVYERLGGELHLKNNFDGGACVKIVFPFFALEPKS